VAGTTISSLSTQYVQVPVRAYSEGLPYNPTGLTVQMGFVSGWGHPGTWNAASWASTSTISGYYIAQCLVGPGSGGVDLAVGTYNVWLMVTSSPEIPVLVSGGTLTIF
jgi:hypothetical protein